MFNKEETVSFLVDLLSINSPTGYTKKAIHFLENSIETMGYETEKTPKGNLIVRVDGQDASKTRGLSAHVDTLGLMVRSINSDGTLALRSEEHTSELQSRGHLVCRLLLEKKNRYTAGRNS